MSFWGDWRGYSTPFPGLRLVRRDAFELVLGDEDAPWLRALVRRDDPAPLEHVDQPAGPRVADAKAALKERHTRGLGGHDDFDRLVEQLILVGVELAVVGVGLDRKSTRLNSSHMSISYAVF